MKKILAILFVYIFPTFILAQDKYEITNKGLINSKDGSQYINVNLPNKSAETITNSLVSYVKQNWNDPSGSITKNIGFIGIDYHHGLMIESNEWIINGNLNIDIKDNKARFLFNFLGATFNSNSLFSQPKSFDIYKADSKTSYLNMNNTYTAYMRQGIYDKKGKIKHPEYKTAVENFINNQIQSIVNYIKGSNIDNNW